MSELEIKFPDWVDYLTEQGTEADRKDYAFQKRINDWFKENVEPINKLLREGVEVYGQPGSMLWSDNNLHTHTHKALLINIQPIKQKTREEKLEDALKDFVEAYPHFDKSLQPQFLKAKKLLESKDE